MQLSRATVAQAGFSSRSAFRGAASPQDAGVSGMSRKLYVGNIPYETNEQDLQELFAQAGAVETVTVMRDRDPGRARGFAFAQMASDAYAQRAMAELSNHQFVVRWLTVNEARSQVPRSWCGGGGGFN